jgi:hypothetical protein
VYYDSPLTQKGITIVGKRMLIVRHIKERISIFYILKGKFRMALVYTACSRDTDGAG